MVDIEGLLMVSFVLFVFVVIIVLYYFNSRCMNEANGLVCRCVDRRR